MILKVVMYNDKLCKLYNLNLNNMNNLICKYKIILIIFENKKEYGFGIGNICICNIKIN